MPWAVSRTSSASRLLSFLTCYHFDLHWEHHRWPYAPWWQLPACRVLAGRIGAKPQDLPHADDGAGAGDADLIMQDKYMDTAGSKASSDSRPQTCGRNSGGGGGDGIHSSASSYGMAIGGDGPLPGPDDDMQCMGLRQRPPFNPEYAGCHVCAAT